MSEKLYKNSNFRFKSKSELMKADDYSSLFCRLMEQYAGGIDSVMEYTALCSDFRQIAGANGAVMLRINPDMLNIEVAAIDFDDEAKHDFDLPSQIEVTGFKWPAADTPASCRSFVPAAPADFEMESPFMQELLAAMPGKGIQQMPVRIIGLNSGKQWNGCVVLFSLPGKTPETNPYTGIFATHIAHYLYPDTPVKDAQDRELPLRLADTQHQLAQLNNVINAIDDMLWQVEFNTGTHYYSIGAQKMFGYPVTDFQNDKDLWWKMIHPEDLEMIKTQYDREASVRGSAEFEYRAIRKDGSEIHVFARIKIEKNPDNSLAKVFGVFSDITNLRRTEQRLNRAQAIAKIGGWELNLRTQELSWSKELYTIFELTELPKNELMEVWFSKIQPEYLPGLQQQIRQAKETGKGFHYEYKIEQTDGQLKTILEIAECIENDRGEITGLIGTAQDITERKKDEENIFRLKTQLDTIVNNIDAAMWSVNMNGEYVFINDTYERKLGYSPSLFYNDKNFWKKIYAPEELERIEAGQEKLMQNGFYELETVVKTSSGKNCWLHIQMKLIEDAAGVPYRIDSFATDISERKNAEFRIEWQNRFQKLIAAISSNLIKTTVQDVDPAIDQALAMTGAFLEVERCFVFQIMHDTNLFSNTHDWHAPHLFSVKHRVQQVPLHRFPWFAREVQKQDLFVIPDVSAAPEESAAEREEWIQQGMQSILFIRLETNSQPIGVFGVATNTFQMTFTADLISKIKVISNVITDALIKNKFELEYIQARERAEASSRAKSEFLANMSHEIRTPMNAIQGYAELLKGKTISPKYEDYLEGILAGGRNLLSLINDILDLSQIEAGKMQMQLSVVNIELLIKELYNIFLQKARQQKIFLSVYIDPDTPLQLIIDEVRVRQVLFNLIGNALKFTSQGCVTVFVRFEKSGNENANEADLLIRVSDTGIGIPQDQQEVIFEYFRQMDGQSTRKYGGSGLGLAITRRLVNMMNGHISLSSEPGVGTTVSVLLRGVRASEYQENKTRWKIAESRYAFLGQEILLVEDNQPNREVIKGFTEPFNLKITEAENGEEALRLLKKKQPALILMDMMMPVMDGYETILKIRMQEHLQDIPIIALTASAMTHHETDIRSICNDYLRKPVSRKELLALLKIYLEHRTYKNEMEPAQPAGKDSGRDNQSAFLAEKSILLVEDNELNRNYMKSILEDAGFYVVVAGDGASSMKLLETNKVNMALVDMGLSDIPGAVLYDRMREYGYTFPATAISGYSAEEIMKSHPGAAFSLYLQKPISPEDLLEGIKKTIQAGKKKRAKKPAVRTYDFSLALKVASGSAVKIHKWKNDFVDKLTLCYEESQEVSAGRLPEIDPRLLHDLLNQVSYFGAIKLQKTIKKLKPESDESSRARLVKEMTAECRHLIRFYTTL